MPVVRTGNPDISTSIGVIDMSTFGDRLRQERERQGYNLDAVAEETKIRTYYLNALEKEDFESLPAQVYATGFVSSYARFLKMDPDALVSEFKSLAYSNPEPQPIPAVKKTRRQVKLPLKNIIAAVLFLAVTLWLGSYVADYVTQRAAIPPPVVQETPVSPPVYQEEKKTPEKLTLAIEAKQNSWLLVKVDGVEQYAGLLKAGDQQSFEADRTIMIRAGNAGGIDLRLNNKQLAPLGGMGQVVEKTFNISTISNE